jgi:hypothetical protein
VAAPLDLYIFQQDGSRRLVRLQENAFTVMAGERETGMAVVREPAGKWAVAHLETGMALAGELDTIYEAEGLAALLAPIDWNQPFDEMPPAELEAAGEIIGRYQARLENLKEWLER